MSLAAIMEWLDRNAVEYEVLPGGTIVVDRSTPMSLVAYCASLLGRPTTRDSEGDWVIGASNTSLQFPIVGAAGDALETPTGMNLNEIERQLDLLLGQVGKGNVVGRGRSEANGVVSRNLKRFPGEAKLRQLLERFGPESVELRPQENDGLIVLVYGLATGLTAGQKSGSPEVGAVIPLTIASGREGRQARRVARRADRQAERAGVGGWMADPFGIQVNACEDEVSGFLDDPFGFEQTPMGGAPGDGFPDAYEVAGFSSYVDTQPYELKAIEAAMDRWAGPLAAERASDRGAGIRYARVDNFGYGG